MPKGENYFGKMTSCPFMHKAAGRLSRHHNLNVFVKQALTSIKVPSFQEPNGLTR